MNIYPPQPVDPSKFIMYRGSTTYGHKTQDLPIDKTKPLMAVLEFFALQNCTTVLTSGGQAFKRVAHGGWRAIQPKIDGETA